MATINKTIEKHAMKLVKKITIFIEIAENNETTKHDYTDSHGNTYTKKQVEDQKGMKWGFEKIDYKPGYKKSKDGTNLNTKLIITIENVEDLWNISNYTTMHFLFS